MLSSSHLKTKENQSFRTSKIQRSFDSPNVCCRLPRTRDRTCWVIPVNTMYQVYMELPYSKEVEPVVFAGLPGWLSGESACQCRSSNRLRLDFWVRKIHWRRKWQTTTVFLPGKSHGQRSLVSYSPWGCKIARHDLATK